MSDPQYGTEHRRRRASWAKHLREVGPVLCGREDCGRLVYPNHEDNFDGMPWHLGHGVAAHHGGTGDDATPWHGSCNLSEAYQISQSDGLRTYQW